MVRCLPGAENFQASFKHADKSVMNTMGFLVGVLVLAVLLVIYLWDNRTGLWLLGGVLAAYVGWVLVHAEWDGRWPWERYKPAKLRPA